MLRLLILLLAFFSEQLQAQDWIRIQDSSKMVDQREAIESLDSIDPSNIYVPFFYIYKHVVPRNDGYTYVSGMRIIPTKDGTSLHVAANKLDHFKMKNELYNRFLKLSQSVVIAKADSMSASGFIIGKDLIITNEHVLDTLKNGTSCNGFSVKTPPYIEGVSKNSDIRKGELAFNCDKVLYCNYDYDFCIIQLSKERIKGALFSIGDLFEIVTLSENIKIGQDITVSLIGNPENKGIQGSAGKGLYSGRAHYTRSGSNIEVSAIVLTHNSPALKGSSGSPIFDNCGRVVGIAHSESKILYGKDAKNFGAPIHSILEILKQSTLWDLIVKNLKIDNQPCENSLVSVR